MHAVQAFRALGYEAVMVNCNPETVSTDYDTSDRLYFEPLDAPSVLAVCEREQPEGVVIQFGGQTPLKLARAIEAAGFRILGTPFDAVDLAEDRERFGGLLDQLGVRCPDWGIAASGAAAVDIADRIGYPVLVRPSYVLGGRAMRVCHDAEQVRIAFAGVQGPTLVDRFLENAVEIDVDALCDGVDTYVGAVMQHVEEAGVHSGDSACVLPAQSLTSAATAEIDAIVQPARPGARRGRTAERPVRDRRRPGVRARGQPARLADGSVRVEGDRRQPRRRGLPARCGSAARRPRPAGRAAAEPGQRQGRRAAVRAVPGGRPGARARDARDRRGDGERERPADGAREGRTRRRAARSRARARSSCRCATSTRRARSRSRRRSPGSASTSTRRPGRPARSGGAGLEVDQVRRVNEPGDGPSVVDLIRRGRCNLIVNTPDGGPEPRSDGYLIRESALAARVPCITTIAAATAAVHAIANARAETALSLQERIDVETAARAS